MMTIYNHPTIAEDLFKEQQQWFKDRTHSKRATIKKAAYKRK